MHLFVIEVHNFMQILLSWQQEFYLHDVIYHLFSLFFKVNVFLLQNLNVKVNLPY